MQKDHFGPGAYRPTRLHQWNLSSLIQGNGKDKKHKILDVAKLWGHPVVARGVTSRESGEIKILASCAQLSSLRAKPYEIIVTIKSSGFHISCSYEAGMPEKCKTVWLFSSISTGNNIVLANACSWLTQGPITAYLCSAYLRLQKFISKFLSAEFIR